jgi:MazG family protein
MNKNNSKLNKSVLDDIPENLSELLRSVKLTQKAATIGFDWSDISPVFEKMQEEIAELKEAIIEGRKDRIKDELGDVIFVCTNLARHLKINPESAIEHANKKFENRFRAVEKTAKRQQPKSSKYDLNYLDQLWNDVKRQES